MEDSVPISHQPPDPFNAADSDKLDEVSHRGIMRLEQLVDGKYHLVNEATHERRELPEGNTTPSLGFAGQYAFIDLGNRSVWASDLLTTSVWRDKERDEHFVVTVFPDRGAHTSMYLTDYHRRSTGHYLSWNMGIDHAMATIRVTVFRAERGQTHSKCFWNLDDVFACVYGARQGNEWVHKNINRRWASVLEYQFGSSGHVLYSSSSAKGLAEQDVLLSDTSVSTIGLLALISRAATTRPEKRKARAIALLKSLFEHFKATEFAMTVVASTLHPVPALDANLRADVSVVDGMVAIGELKSRAIISKVGYNSRRYLTSDDCPMQEPLANFLVRCAARKGLEWLWRQAAAQCAKVLERNWQHSCATTDPLAHPVYQHGHKRDAGLRKCLAVKALSRARAIRNGRKLASAATALAKPIGPANSSGAPDYAKSHEMFLYFKAMRKAFHGCLQVCVAVDAARVSQRNRLCGPAMNLQTGECAWPPPLVPPLGMNPDPFGTNDSCYRTLVGGF